MPKPHFYETREDRTSGLPFVPICNFVVRYRRTTVFADTRINLRKILIPRPENSSPTKDANLNYLQEDRFGQYSTGLDVTFTSLEITLYKDLLTTNP